MQREYEDEREKPFHNAMAISLLCPGNKAKFFDLHSTRHVEPSDLHTDVLPNI
jgi:hypothetical protein